jgi:hypothetical protein
MTSRFTEIVIDCQDPRRLAEFWCAALGYEILDEEDGDIEVGDMRRTAADFRVGVQPPTLMFIKVPEPKSTKNRLHIDISPIDREQSDEVSRLLDLGATHVDIGQGERGWVVLADPEGNEFCVLRSLYATD